MMQKSANAMAKANQFGWLYVLFSIFLMSLYTFTTIYVVGVDGLLRDECTGHASTADEALYFAFMGIILSLFGVAWIRAMVRGGGNVPPNWTQVPPPNRRHTHQNQNDDEDNDQIDNDQNENDDERNVAYIDGGNVRIYWCQRCGVWKPPRTHHSGYSDRCVLQYDHYCRWIASPVGYRNRKFFMLLVLYGFLGCVFFDVSFLWRWIVFALDTDACSLHVAEIVVMAAASLAVVVQTFSLGYMAAFHAHLLANNMTNVEYACCNGTLPECHFDAGLYRNVCDVLGDHWFLWLLPIDVSERRHQALGHGTSFRPTSLYQAL
jgi:DHHC palmitoyltransferase